MIFSMFNSKYHDPYFELLNYMSLYKKEIIYNDTISLLDTELGYKPQKCQLWQLKLVKHPSNKGIQVGDSNHKKWRYCLFIFVYCITLLTMILSGFILVYCIATIIIRNIIIYIYIHIHDNYLLTSFFSFEVTLRYHFERVFWNWLISLSQGSS